MRARRYEIGGDFTTKDGAYYIEDNWSVTPTFLLNAGLRLDGFDNRDGAGRSNIKTDRHARAALRLLVGHEG